jgi:hypothetical protein
MHLPATHGTLHVSPQPPQLFESVCSFTQDPLHEVCPSGHEMAAPEPVPLFAPPSTSSVVPPVDPLPSPVLVVLPLAVLEPLPVVATAVDVPATEALPEPPAVVPVADPKTEPALVPELPSLPAPALAPFSRPPHAEAASARPSGIEPASLTRTPRLVVQDGIAPQELSHTGGPRPLIFRHRPEKLPEQAPTRPVTYTLSIVPPPSNTPSRAVLAAIVALGGCGGRASGILGAGSGANEGGSSGSVTSATLEGSTGESQPDGSMADSPTATESEGSIGNAIVDAGAEATGAGGGSVDATEGLEASALMDATDATEIEADIVVPCGPPASGTYFVDPIAGHDDDGGTGSQACPFKSLTHALSLVGDAGTPVTVEIINTSAAPTLSQSTGEVFPITVPGGVTITAEDTTKNTPAVEVGAMAAELIPPGGMGCPASCARGFYLFQPSARLSHLVVSDASPADRDYGITIVSPGTVIIDHVLIENFRAGGDGIAITSDGPRLALP